MHGGISNTIDHSMQIVNLNIYNQIFVLKSQALKHTLGKKVARANGEASRLRLDLERVNTENDNLKQSNAEKDVELNEMMELVREQQQVVREQQQIFDEVEIRIEDLKKDLQGDLETTKL